jgi:hypothetical protein
VSGVEPQHDSVGEKFADAPKPERVEQGARTEDDALDPPAENVADVRFGPQAAAELTRNAGIAKDGADYLTVYRLALFCPVEVHEVKPVGALFDPAAGNRNGIVAKDGFLCVITLTEANAMAAPDVNRWIDLHAIPRSRAS